MSSPSDLGAAIRAAGLRPRDIVRALDISWTALSKWQRREVCPRGDHLLGLADLIGLSPRETLDLVLPASAAAPAAPSAQLEILALIVAPAGAPEVA